MPRNRRNHASIAKVDSLLVQLGLRRANLITARGDLGLPGGDLPGAADGGLLQRSLLRGGLVRQRHRLIDLLLGDGGGIETLVSCDIAPEMAVRAPGLRVAADEEFLPFADHSFDLVMSCLSLHWVNDLPGALIQIRRVLKPDGLFLASFLGGSTLKEMRRAWLEAESAVEGGVGPRVSPFADVRDAGSLLQRAGFALPVVDSDIITVTYADPLTLMTEVKLMGESNAVAAQRKGFTRRDTLFAAAESYREMFAGEDGRIPATFEIITMTAWTPDPSQQQPLKPGSAVVNLADVLRERAEKAGHKGDA